MSKRVSISKVRKLVAENLKHQRAYAEAFKGSENPQIIVMGIEARAQADAYEAVLCALNGDNVLLNISR